MEDVEFSIPEEAEEARAADGELTPSKKRKQEQEEAAVEAPVTLAAEEEAIPIHERFNRLTARLLSPSVRLELSSQPLPEAARLNPKQVEAVFKRYVPGISEQLYRNKPGNRSLKFICTVYRDGLRQFQGTELHERLIGLMRLIVNHGADNKPGASKFLKEVAEAFKDCQAVQARAIERVGLLILGVTLDFRGHLVRLVGAYKSISVKMVASAECVRLGGIDDFHDPTHYESLLLVSFGDELGLNEGDTRQAQHDDHISRFEGLEGDTRDAVLAQLRSSFDMDALLKAFASEVNSFSESTPQDSLSSLFLVWVGDAVEDKHIVLDEETCSRVVVDDVLALAVLERVFLGQVTCPAARYRGRRLRDVFREDRELMAQVEQRPPAIRPKPSQAELLPWQVLEVNLGGKWAKIEASVCRQAAEAEAKGLSEINFRFRGFAYLLDIQNMVQVNLETGTCRPVRCAQERPG